MQKQTNKTNRNGQLGWKDDVEMIVQSLKVEISGDQ
jgi:hypothetical protein